MKFLQWFMNLFGGKKTTTPTVTTNKNIEQQIDDVIASHLHRFTHLLAHNKKLNYWQAFFKALASAESGFVLNKVYPEKGLGKDAVTGKQNTSEGLTQMSYQDSKFHGCNFDWSIDKNKSEKDLTKSIFNIVNNIECAMIVLDKQLKNGKPLYSQYYWSVLNPERADGHARFLTALKKYLAENNESSPSEIPSETPWMDFAIKEIGQEEISGKKHNPRIVEYHQETGLKASDDETPWCASFVCWCLEKSGIKSTRSAWARDFLNWGVKIDKPVKGCIVVFKRGTNSGHVAFYEKDAGNYVNVLGGNQSNKVKYANYSKSDILGYRMPSV